MNCNYANILPEKCTTFKNYKELCHYLNIPCVGGQQKIRILTELQRFYHMEKQGHKLSFIKREQFIPKQSKSRNYHHICTLILHLLQEKQVTQYTLTTSEWLAFCKMLDVGIHSRDEAMWKYMKEQSYFAFYSNLKRCEVLHIDKTVALCLSTYFKQAIVRLSELGYIECEYVPFYYLDKTKCYMTDSDIARYQQLQQETYNKLYTTPEDNGGNKPYMETIVRKLAFEQWGWKFIGTEITISVNPNCAIPQITNEDYEIARTEMKLLWQHHLKKAMKQQAIVWMQHYLEALCQRTITLESINTGSEEYVRVFKKFFQDYLPMDFDYVDFSQEIAQGTLKRCNLLHLTATQ